MNKLDLGPCCACEKVGPAAHVRNVIMYHKLSPIPGRGWGCFVCRLPQNGAVIVLCDGCFEQHVPPRFACRGYPGEDGRVPIEELVGWFHHDLDRHTEDVIGRWDDE
jgi:hypothetical protein